MSYLEAMGLRPIAACITGGARLMLAMLERCVTDLGGTYAFCDTDSMAIVATTQRRLIDCPGGAQRRTDGTEAIRAISHADVQAIRHRFTSLNPYDPAAVSDTILKLEDTGTCLAVSAKRYCIYRTANRGSELLKRPEHGLGHLLKPTTLTNPTETGSASTGSQPVKAANSTTTGSADPPSRRPP